jgi:hypothetical protein
MITLEDSKVNQGVREECFATRDTEADRGRAGRLEGSGMDPNDWYAAEILVKERLGDLRRTAESLRSRDGRPRPSLRVVVRTTLARLALSLLRRERRPAVPEPDRLNRPPCLSDVSLPARTGATLRKE